MSSFFVRNKPNSSLKRKNGKVAQSNISYSKKSEEDEIDTDEEINSEEGENAVESHSEDEETPQDKRLRLAKKYLEEIEKEEKSRAADADVHDILSHRLREEYLESVGKLRKNIAHLYKGYLEDSTKILKHKKQKAPITCMVLSGDDKFLFTGCKNASLVKWDMTTLSAIGSFECLDETEDKNSDRKRRPNILALALSSDNKFLAVANGWKTIQVWCPISLKHIKTFRGHMDVVTCLAFRKGTHQLYSGSKDRSVKVWSLDEMAYVESLFGHQAGITGIDALSRERAITSGGTDCSVRIWKIVEESQLIYVGHKGSIEDVKLINEEQFLSCGDDGSLSIWTASRKKPLCVEKLVHGTSSNNEPNWISAIAALLNSDLIASGSCDGSVKVWQIIENGKKLVKLFEIPVCGFVNSLQFTNDGSHLIVGVGQEHRLGRWWRVKASKNCILVIKFNKIS